MKLFELRHSRYQNIFYWIPAVISVVMTLALIWFLPDTIVIQFMGDFLEGFTPSAYCSRLFILLLPVIHVGYLFLVGLFPVMKKPVIAVDGVQKFWRIFHGIITVLLFLGQLALFTMNL